LHFVHGLAFFALGTVLVLLGPRASRLEVARRLPLLAVFGFCEALAEWDHLLAPVLGADWPALSLGRTVLLGIGYLFLLSFGLLGSVSSGEEGRERTGLTVLLGAGWLLGLLSLFLLGWSIERVTVLGEAVARYVLAMLGGLSAAWGLRQQAYRTMGTPILSKAKLPLRIAGVSLGAFGVLSGLQVLADVVHFPMSILYAACGVGILLSVVRALDAVQQEIERWIEEAEQTQALARDRERISRELHDGTIQAIYAAGLMLEGVMQTITEDPSAARIQLARAMASLNQTIQDIRRYIFNLRGELPEANLHTGLEQLLRDFRVNTLLDTSLAVIGEKTRPLRAEQRAHILQVARELLSNTARHARARGVEVSVTYKATHVELRVTDDGVGLGRGTVQRGHGLRNIQDRVHLLEGELQVASAPGEGVAVTLNVPY
jgi:signal transduction histidine kinase